MAGRHASDDGCGGFAVDDDGGHALKVGRGCLACDGGSRLAVDDRRGHLMVTARDGGSRLALDDGRGSFMFTAMAGQTWSRRSLQRVEQTCSRYSLYSRHSLAISEADVLLTFAATSGVDVLSIFAATNEADALSTSTVTNGADVFSTFAAMSGAARAKARAITRSGVSML